MKDYSETKRLVLLVISLFSLPVCLAGGLVFSCFWYAVISTKTDYTESIFEVSEITYVKYGSKIRYEVALGSIAGQKEILYGWKEYLTTRPQLLEAPGRHIPVMYNANANDFHYSGRNLRVLSLHEFKTARGRLLQSLAFACISPILWITYFRFCSKRKGEHEIA